MIRKLLKKGLSYRAIADLCQCSHGSVHAEVVALRKETQALDKKKAEELQLAKEQAEALARLTQETKDPKFPDVQAAQQAAA